MSFVDYLGMGFAIFACSYVGHAFVCVIRNTIREGREARQKADALRAERLRLELEGELMLRSRPAMTYPAPTPPGVPLRAKVYRRGDLEVLLAQDMVRRHGLPDGNFQYHVIYMVQSDGTFLGVRMELAKKSRRARR